MGEDVGTRMCRLQHTPTGHAHCVSRSSRVCRDGVSLHKRFFRPNRGRDERFRHVISGLGHVGEWSRAWNLVASATSTFNIRSRYSDRWEETEDTSDCSGSREGVAHVERVARQMRESTPQAVSDSMSSLHCRSRRAYLNLGGHAMCVTGYKWLKTIAKNGTRRAVPDKRESESLFS
jgi:hypothetical protein